MSQFLLASLFLVFTGSQAFTFTGPVSSRSNTLTSHQNIHSGKHVSKGLYMLEVSKVSRGSLIAFGAAVVLKPFTVIAEDSTDSKTPPTKESDQVISLDDVNFKQLAVLGGALFVADIISGALTGRSVLKIVGNEKAGEISWRQKLVDDLLEKEKKEAAARMGVSTTTKTPRGPSATGDFASTDPFEIAKQRYTKPKSLDELKRELSEKLDGTTRDLGFDDGKNN